MLGSAMERLRRRDTEWWAWRRDRATYGPTDSGITAVVVGLGRPAAGFGRRIAARDGRRDIGIAALAAIDSMPAAGTADYLPRISR
jgi:hypothetical protein